MEERLLCAQPTAAAISGARSLVLLIACLASLMVNLDGSIVIVALPTIGSTLGANTNSLIWLVNAYALTSSGFLLMSGRLGDCYGHRRLFLLGIVLFMLASLACALAETPNLMIGARAFQGAAGTVIWTVSVSLVMREFEEPAERAQAMAVYSSIQAVGSAAGMLIGGLVTHELNWRWLFFINLPVGIIICTLYALTRFERRRENTQTPMDFAGAATITISLLLAIYAAQNAAAAGWFSAGSGIPLGCALSFLALFVVIETRVKNPLIPSALLRERNLSVSMGAGMLWGGASIMFWVISALYMQRVLGYDALKLGLAFLPVALIEGLFSFGLSARLVRRFGCKALITIGVALEGAGMLLLGRAPTAATYGTTILPAMLLVGLGSGVGSGPYFLGGLRKVGNKDYGIAAASLSGSLLLGSVIALSLAGQAVARDDRYVVGVVTQQLVQPTSYSISLCAAALLAGSAALVIRYIDE